MKQTWLTATGIIATASMTVAAAAQRPPIQETPLPPLQKQGPLPQNPLSPGFSGQSQGQTATGQAPTSPMAPPPAIVERSNVWIPAGAVRLQALDKVNAQATVLTIKVGGSATFGSLTIGVRACMVRPADQPADAAAFLDVTDSHSDSLSFDGWMLQAEPSVSMMQHPIYDLRVSGCA